MTTYQWPNKLIPEFTLEELIAALQAAERGDQKMNPAVVESCRREWERRHGLSEDEA
ncbi:hypothetical protein ACIRRH_41150 [Kitasatospora sp. NPDC101235]|uniref:hypothetical protein n=1 Tax=Kitasatospora sp. NPDC101235 TaxID=3364101 RepID=UPI003824CE96